MVLRVGQPPKERGGGPPVVEGGLMIFTVALGLMTPFLATAFHRSSAMEVTVASRVAFKNEPYG